MPTKMAEVLAIPELLEAILLQLPQADVLFAQRVNKTFRDAIQGSISIRRHLFYEQSTSPSSHEQKVEPPRINPILHRSPLYVRRIDDTDAQREVSGAGRHCAASYNEHTRWQSQTPSITCITCLHCHKNALTESDNAPFHLHIQGFDLLCLWELSSEFLQQHLG